MLTSDAWATDLGLPFESSVTEKRSTIVTLPSFILMVGISMLELLVAAIQAYVFALLTSVYLNDAVNLH